jgi:hypothetical protein
MNIGDASGAELRELAALEGCAHRENAPTWSVTRLEHGHLVTVVREHRGGRQSGEPGAGDDDTTRPVAL